MKGSAKVIAELNHARQSRSSTSIFFTPKCSKTGVMSRNTSRNSQSAKMKHAEVPMERILLDGTLTIKPLDVTIGKSDAAD